jgi:hypothetical protein
MNQTKRQIYEAIIYSGKDGIDLRELCGYVGRSYTLVKDYVNELHREGAVCKVRTPGFNLICVPNHSSAVMNKAQAIKDEAKRRSKLVKAQWGKTRRESKPLLEGKFIHRTISASGTTIPNGARISSVFKLS